APANRGRQPPARFSHPVRPQRAPPLPGHPAPRPSAGTTDGAAGWLFRYNSLWIAGARAPAVLERNNTPARRGSERGLFMAKGAGKTRKKLPKELAVIRADNCTGCEACIEVCPVDCIYKVPGEDQPSLQSFCDIDLERCIGCKLCERWCPWDAIDMVPTPQIAEATAKNGERLFAVAKELGDLAREQRTPAKKA